MKMRKLLTVAGMGLLGAAVATELRKPPEERTWEGTVGGVVPYDLRPPTAERFRERLWNPDSTELLTPHPFGVGWGVNFAQLQRRLQELAGSDQFR